jgi:hypothetical protein
MPALKVEQWPIDRLVDYARNPRKNDAHVDRMAGAIREFGFRIPICAKSDGTVVDGHLRLKAARKLGLTEVPVALADTQGGLSRSAKISAPRSPGRMREQPRPPTGALTNARSRQGWRPGKSPKPPAYPSLRGPIPAMFPLLGRFAAKIVNSGERGTARRRAETLGATKPSARCGLRLFKTQKFMST